MEQNKAFELAERLNNGQYGKETTSEQKEYAKREGLIIVYGASDDLVEIEGAIEEELMYGVILLNPKGKKIELYDEDENETWEEGGQEAIAIQLKEDTEVYGNRIEAEYDGVWKFKTQLPHYTFNIFEEDELFCVGLVINEKDLE